MAAKRSDPNTTAYRAPTTVGDRPGWVQRHRLSLRYRPGEFRQTVERSRRGLLVPTGSYLHSDGTTERFQCAPGPAGWRYVGELPDEGRVDVAVDSRGRPARVELRAGGWVLRGGVSGPEVIWLRAAAADPAEALEHSAAAAGFSGRSPGLLVATARSLRLAMGDTVRIRLVRVTDPVLATVLVDQEWSLTEFVEHPTESRPLPVEGYRIIDLATGTTERLHLCGDVALSGPGVELDTLRSPPTLP